MLGGCKWRGAARAGDCAVTAHAPDAIVLAPGHEITQSGIQAKEKEFEGVSLSDVLVKAGGVHSGTIEAIRDLDKIFFGSTALSAKYRHLAARKNWPAFDKLFLDALSNRHHGYNIVLEAEEWMRAFSARLCAEAGVARSAYRWLDPPELKSYVNGTFESRVESGFTRRGYKALSMNPNLKFEARKVMLEVPLDLDIRRSIRCVRYTVIPREIDVADEKISDPKHAAFVTEAEVRVPDGAAVPPGAVFTIEPGTQVDQGVVMELEKRYAVVR